MINMVSKKKTQKKAGGVRKMPEDTYAKWNKSNPGVKSAVARTWGKYGPMIRDALKELGGEIDYAKMKDFCAKHDKKYPWVKSNTLQRQLYSFTVNCEGRIHYKSNKNARGYDGKIDILFDTGGGKLVNYEPGKHGEWRIIMKDGKPQIDKVGVSQQDTQETVFDFETLKKKFLKEFGTKKGNYQEVAAKTLLDATNFTDDGKKIKENVDKLNFGKPLKQGFGTNATEMCREKWYAGVGIVYNKAKGYSLALALDTTEKQKKELKGICGRYIAKMHIDLQNPSGSGE